MERALPLAISIDTEIDKSMDWTMPCRATYRSVLDGIPGTLTPLFEKYGARPTYLLSSEIIEQPDCVDVLTSLQNCELGTHLHGDLIEPQRRITKLVSENIKDMQCSYTREVERAKIGNLTKLYEKTFGRSPTSFRAGRYGAGNNTIPCLEELGYLVDSSVTPGLIWDYEEGTADFRNAMEQPYYPSREDITREGESRVLEVPISIVSLIGKRILGKLGDRTNPPFAPLPGLFSYIWVRPSYTGAFRMKYAVKKMLNNDGHDEAIVLNIMFHSMEVIPGASPVCRTSAQVKDFMRRLEQILGYCKEKGFSFATLTEVSQYFKR